MQMPLSAVRHAAHIANVQGMRHVLMICFISVSYENGEHVGCIERCTPGR